MPVFIVYINKEYCTALEGETLKTAKITSCKGWHMRPIEYEKVREKIIEIRN